MNSKTEIRSISYEAGVVEASKPISERQACFVGRNGARKIPRRHHLNVQDQSALLREIREGGKFVSPFHQFGAYDSIVCALRSLGENEAHLLGEVVDEIEKYLSHELSKDRIGRTAWERFRDRQPHSIESGKDSIGRIMQNINVLQRIGGTDPYALKLAQLGACIDILSDPKGAPLIRLRTGIPAGEKIIPINELKKRQCSRPSGVTYLISQRSYGNNSPVSESSEGSEN